MNLTEAFEANPKGAMVCIHGYRNAKGDTANYFIQPGISWANALVKTMVAVAGMTPESIVSGCPTLMGTEADQVLAVEARLAVLDSLFKAVCGANRVPYDYRAPGLAVYQGDISEPDPVYFVRGLLVRKVAVVEAPPRKVKSRPLTLVKNWILKGQPTTRFRTMKLELERFEYVAVNGERFSPHDIYPQSLTA